MSIFFKKLFVIIACIATASSLAINLPSSSFINRSANAIAVRACSASETLEGDNCTLTKIAYPQYETKCAAGYTQMDAVCANFIVKTCTTFTQSLDAENGMCKLDLSSPVYGTEIQDHDGRQCNGNGTNFKRYNVGLDRNDKTGPIICGNNFSLLDKSTFRFLPRSINEISNLASIQTNDIFPACPVGYSELAPNKCSRPTVVQKCSQGGETFVNNACIPCPAGQYCPVDGVVSKTMTVCASGGNLSNNICIAPVKYSSISYTDGCTSEYITKDKSCAVIESRTHDTGCSYFYSSEHVNVTAVLGSGGYCSTGGRSDFESANITRVSDFNCNGVGTYYYNYNVAFDPLVCGNDYNVVGKTGFKWLPATFTKITALQKIPNTSTICPLGWTSFDNSNNCSQAPIIQEYKHPIDCPINTYCPGSNVNPLPCPAGSQSPVRSTKLSDCISIVCNNGAVNPPACNQCPAGLEIVNQLCLPVCPGGVTRDANNNCTICVNGAVNPSSGCNACSAGYQFGGNGCTPLIVVVCKNGFELIDRKCVCPLPKTIINRLDSATNKYKSFCETLASSSSNSSLISSSSSLISSSISSSSVVASSSSLSSSSALPVSISGYVYVDSNNNGIFENTESPIGGVTITLTGTQESCKNVNVATTTNASGFYNFTNLAACSYSVVQTQPTNYINGITSVGTVNGAIVGNTFITNKIDNINLSSGQNSINNNFGELFANVPTNNNGTIVINNNTPVTNNNNSVNNNIVNNYATLSEKAIQAPKPQLIPVATPVNITYTQSPVTTVTETIRSGGFNVILILASIIAIASFGLVYTRGKRNQGFSNYTLSNSLNK